MTQRKWHRRLGLLLILPLLVWVVTGLVFLFKPGYGEAYNPLAVKTYELESLPTLIVPTHWRDLKISQSILGTHYLATLAGGQTHRFIPAKSPLPDLSKPLALINVPEVVPTDEALKRLIDDAMAQNRPRYGELVSFDGNVAITSTNVKITLDWPRLSLRQEGRDTRFINNLYKAHYLQWWGIKWLNQAFAVFVLFFLVVSAGFGLALIRRSRQRW